MARSCGLRIGPRRFELVVIEGSAKKHKITAYMTGDLPREGDDPIGSAAAILREAVKTHNIPRDNVGVAIDTGLAAFRTIKVPFSDKNKIEEVIKFEVESQLPQWNIDDVVVDFQILEATDGASELLVTAVPKSDVSTVLSMCEKAGIEPLEVELETTAMVNAAMTASICTVDNAQVLVHIGETSTSVVVMDGGKVREMRAIHIGALSHEYPSALAEPEVAVEGQPPPEAAPEEVKDPLEVQRRLEQAIKRIRRELGRTVSAARTVHPIEAVYVCGLELPGLAGSRILDADVRVLDVFEADGGQPTDGFGPLVVPYGVAVRQLGGGMLRPSLRREELHYSGAFERVELPLAVVALLVVTFLGVWFIFLLKEQRMVDQIQLAFWRDSARIYVLGDPQKGQAGDLQYPPQRVIDYVKNWDQDTDLTKFEQLRRLTTLIQEDVKKLEKDLGQDAEIKQPQSAFTATVLVMDVLAKQWTDDVRPSMRSIAATYQPARSTKPDHVKVDINMSFLARDSVTATQAFDDFTRDMRAQPWMLEFTSKVSEPVEGGKGIFLSNVSIDVDVSKAPAMKGAQ
jgi:Tfp pilus assembly PilM family ATPase